MSERFREKRVLLTPKEEEVLDRLVERLERQLDCKIGLSNLIRSALRAVRERTPHVLDAARELGPLDRPPYGDERALARFEKDLAKVILKGLRKRQKRRKRSS